MFVCETGGGVGVNEVSMRQFVNLFTLSICNVRTQTRKTLDNFCVLSRGVNTPSPPPPVPRLYCKAITAVKDLRWEKSF